MSTLTCPEFTHLDADIIADFNACLQENIEEVEYCINKLDECEDHELVHELFRAMHSLKGNCRMVLLNPFVVVTHELEEIVSEMRDGTRHYHELYGSLFITVIGVMEGLIYQLAEIGECRKDILEEINQLITEVRKAESCTTGKDLEVLEDVAVKLVNIQDTALEIDSPAEVNQSPEVSTEEKQTDSEVIETISIEQKDKNIKYFRQLAIKLDSLSIYRQGRTNDSLKLCEALNQEAGNPVDELQLKAAVYIHDIGMAFIPAKILNKEEKLSREELIVIKSHIQVGADLLSSIPGWQDASEMVQQHHERFDGTGYPKGLSGKQINSGAMILALADTYLAITNERSDRSYKRNLFSAVTLINGESDGQFDPDLVEVFNETIRKLYLSPS